MCRYVWSSSWQLHELVHTFLNLKEKRIQLLVARSFKGRQPSFSRNLANQQLALRVSPDKQMSRLHTEKKLSNCHLPDDTLSSQKISGKENSFIISSPKHAPITGKLRWICFHSFPQRAHAKMLCICHFLFTSLTSFLRSALFISVPCLVSSPLFLLSCDSGADDLLPILSFVALRCQCPQLVSECAALEEFIHEG